MNGSHYSSASKVVKQFSRALDKMSPQMPRPTTDEITKVKSGFFDEARFPISIGVLDCTHIKIKSLSGQNAEPLQISKRFL